MAEIEITLPTVQYGNVKVRATPEEWGLDTIADAPDVGVWAATYLNLFQQGFKVGAAMDVDAHLGGREGPVSAPTDAEVAKAAILLEEGLGGVTELPDDEQKSQVVKDWEKSQSPDAPWNSTVDAKPKPWEAEETQAPATQTKSASKAGGSASGAKPAAVVTADW